MFAQVPTTPKLNFVRIQPRITVIHVFKQGELCHFMLTVYIVYSLQRLNLLIFVMLASELALLHDG